MKERRGQSYETNQQILFECFEACEKLLSNAEVEGEVDPGAKPSPRAVIQGETIERRSVWLKDAEIPGLYGFVSDDGFDDWGAERMAFGYLVLTTHLGQPRSSDKLEIPRDSQTDKAIAGLKVTRINIFRGVRDDMWAQQTDYPGHGYYGVYDDVSIDAPEARNIVASVENMVPISFEEFELARDAHLAAEMTDQMVAAQYLQKLSSKSFGYYTEEGYSGQAAQRGLIGSLRANALREAVNKGDTELIAIYAEIGRADQSEELRRRQSGEPDSHQLVDYMLEAFSLPPARREPTLESEKRKRRFGKAALPNKFRK